MGLTYTTLMHVTLLTCIWQMHKSNLIYI